MFGQVYFRIFAHKLDNDKKILQQEMAYKRWVSKIETDILYIALDSCSSTSEVKYTIPKEIDAYYLSKLLKNRFKRTSVSHGIPITFTSKPNSRHIVVQIASHNSVFDYSHSLSR